MFLGVNLQSLSGRILNEDSLLPMNYRGPERLVETLQTRPDVTASSVNDPTHTQGVQRESLSRSFADIDLDFCEVGLIKGELCEQAEAALLFVV